MLAEWLVLSVVLLSYATRGVIVWRNIKTILLVGTFSALSVLLVVYFPFTALFIYLVLLTLALIYIGQLNADYYYPTFIILFLTLLAACMPDTVVSSVYRAISIGVAALIVAVLQLVYSPWFIAFHVRRWVVQAVWQLDAVANEVFACLLQPDYAETIYLFERRLHEQKNKLMQSILLLHQVSKEKKMNEATQEWLIATLTQLDALFALLLECAMVRWRVMDQSVFALCRNELLAVYGEMCKLLSSLVRVIRAKQENIDLESFKHSVQLLEENYQHVLQVAAPDPLALLLFIDSLKLFGDKADDIRGIKNEA